MTPERHRFVERLAYYLIGIAIGLMALGIFWSARQRAANARGGNPVAVPGPAAPGGPEAPAATEPAE